MFVKKEEKNFDIKDNILVGRGITNSVEKTPVSKLILDSLNESPNFVGQFDIETGKAIKFAEIKERSIRCALWLRKQGIGKNDVICISTSHRIDDYVPCLATYYVGAIFNPWYHDLTDGMLEYFFKLMQPKIVFADLGSITKMASVTESLKYSCEFICYEKHQNFKSLNDILSEQDKIEIENFECIHIDDPETRIAAVFFSSGTTGIQKGAALSYETIANNRFKYIFNSEGSNKLWYSSMSWITGSNAMISAIIHKCTRFIHKQFDPEEISIVIERYKINWMFITPSMLAQMVNEKIFKRYDFSSLEVIMLTGSIPKIHILKDVEKALPHVLLSNSYGMSEIGGWATLQTKNKRRIDSVGKILEILQMKIVDPKTGQKLGPNKRGEIYIKLKNYMLGYYKNPEETKTMFDNEGWLKTGDEGYYDNLGEVTIINRIKQVIIVQNFHISPLEIENQLLQHPDVLEAAVTSVPHDIDIERPIAFVKLRPNAKVTKEELMELPVKYNEYFRLTGGVIFIDEIPRTISGKVSIKVLKEMAKELCHSNIV